MFTGSENGLTAQYVDPDSNMIRNYYPDILVYYKDGSIEIIEVKGDNRINDKEVEAKGYAMMTLAEQCGMSYDIVKSSDIMNGSYIIKDSAKSK
jgi:type III restriction enzyme